MDTIDAKDLSIGEMRMRLNEGDRLIFEDERFVFFRKKSAPVTGQANIPIEIAAVGIAGLHETGKLGMDPRDYKKILSQIILHVQHLIDKEDGKPTAKNA